MMIGTTGSQLIAFPAAVAIVLAAFAPVSGKHTGLAENPSFNSHDVYVDSAVNQQTVDEQSADQHSDVDLLEQLREMQFRMSQLESALKQNHTQNSGASSVTESGTHGAHQQGNSGGQQHANSDYENRQHANTPQQDIEQAGMQGMGMQGMGMQGMGMQGMGMQGMGMQGMNEQGNMMGGGMMRRGMMMMGRMKGMDGMNVPSSLPGFPGASHIYHIGADGFFLNHARHISLSTQQQENLNNIKEESLLQQADFDRRIEAAEQELWVLTASDRPEAALIEQKIEDIGDLQSRQRMAFIRSVGAAADALDDHQRGLLTGSDDSGNPEGETGG